MKQSKQIYYMMTKRRKRTLEKEINSRLYNNLAREGVELRHLDPTRLGNWPLFEYQESDSDYINLLPPSYRNPFPDSGSSSRRLFSGGANYSGSTKSTTTPGNTFSQGLPPEWSAKLYTGSLSHAKSSVKWMRHVFILLAGLLITGLLIFV